MTLALPLQSSPLLLILPLSNKITRDPLKSTCRQEAHEVGRLWSRTSKRRRRRRRKKGKHPKPSAALTMLSPTGIQARQARGVRPHRVPYRRDSSLFPLHEEVARRTRVPRGGHLHLIRLLTTVPKPQLAVRNQYPILRRPVKRSQDIKQMAKIPRRRAGEVVSKTCDAVLSECTFIHVNLTGGVPMKTTVSSTPIPPLFRAESSLNWPSEPHHKNWMNFRIWTGGDDTLRPYGGFDFVRILQMCGFDMLIIV